LTLGSLTPRSNTLDGVDKFSLDLGLDVEYYLKIVKSEYVDPFWGSTSLYEFGKQENVVPRDPNVPKVEFKY